MYVAETLLRALRTRTVRIKTNATICKFCELLFRATLLWFVQEALGYGIAAHFKCTTIFAKHAVFSWQKAPQSKDYSTLQDGTLRCSHQSAALLQSKCCTLGGRKQHDLHHFFKCRHAAFVAFFLTCTVYSSVHN